MDTQLIGVKEKFYIISSSIKRKSGYFGQIAYFLLPYSRNKSLGYSICKIFAKWLNNVV